MPKPISTPGGSAGSQTPKTSPSHFAAEGSELLSPCVATADLPSAPRRPDRKALADRLRPWRPRALPRHLPMATSSSEDMPQMPGLVAGWHKACIVRARRPERQSNCLSRLAATICWQRGLCHYITGDSLTCKQIPRTCPSCLILDKQ